MELTQLRAFRTVAETQSFTRAAERLNLTQSAVSRQIGALEHELGEPLFVRGRRRSGGAFQKLQDSARRAFAGAGAAEFFRNCGQRGALLFTIRFIENA